MPNTAGVPSPRAGRAGRDKLPAMRKVLALPAILGLLALGLLWWTGRQGARLPGWYLEARQAGTLEADLEAAARRSQRALVGRFGRELLDEVTADDGTPDESFFERIKRRGKMVLEGLREGREVRLDAGDLEDLILSTAYEDEAGRRLLSVTRAVHAEIVGGELRLSAVVRPADLPSETLADGRRQILGLLLQLAGSDGDVHLSLRAMPRAVEDRLVLGPPVDLRIGALELSPALPAALGVEAPELETGVVLDVGGARVRQAAIEGEVLILVISPEI